MALLFLFIEYEWKAFIVNSQFKFITILRYNQGMISNFELVIKEPFGGVFDHHTTVFEDPLFAREHWMLQFYDISYTI